MVMVYLQRRTEVSMRGSGKAVSSMGLAKKFLRMEIPLLVPTSRGTPMDKESINGMMGVGMKESLNRDRGRAKEN